MPGKNNDKILFTTSNATSTVSGHLPYPIELTRSETGASSNYGSQPHTLDSQDLINGDEVYDYNVSSPGLFISRETLVQISKGDKSYIIRSRELNQANLESILDAGWAVSGYQGAAQEEEIYSLLNIPDLRIQLVFAIAEEEPSYVLPKDQNDDDDHEDAMGGGANMQPRNYIKTSEAGIQSKSDDSSQSTTYNTEGSSYSHNLLPFLFIGSICYLYIDSNTIHNGIKTLAGAVTHELLPDYLFLQS